MGTSVNLVLDASERVSPVAEPVAGNDASDALRDAAVALTKAAEQIAALVSILQGKPVSSLPLSLNTAGVVDPVCVAGPVAGNGSPRSAAFSPATVSESINAFLVAKARAAKSDRYLRAMKNSLSKFARGRGSRLLGDVTPDEIDSWLARSDWSGTTRRGYLRDVRTLYNFALRRSLVGHNPAACVELPASSAGPIQIHTPEDVQTVLNLARSYCPNVCRALVVRYFAGIRSSECDRLHEEAIRTDTGFIEVTAQNSKTRSRRLIEIEPSLLEWLKLGGKLPLGDAGNRIRHFIAALREKHGIGWPSNVTRHSFCSYGVALWGPKETAMKAGHSEDMLFRHYRAVVTKEQAKAFFAIRPQ